MISFTERFPGEMTRFDGLPVVGSQPSFRL